MPIQIISPPDSTHAHNNTLVLVLYGYSLTAEKFGRVARHLAQSGFQVALPESPYAFLSEWGYGHDWTLHNKGDEALEARARNLMVSESLPGLLRALEKRCGAEDIHIMGFSQGAQVAIQTGIHASELVQGVIAFGLSGYETEWFEDHVFESARRIPILLLHGEEDEWDAISISRRARDHLVSGGFPARLRLFAGGHSVPNDQLDFVAQWIRESKVSGEPR